MHRRGGRGGGGGGGRGGGGGGGGGERVESCSARGQMTCLGEEGNRRKLHGLKSTDIQTR